MARPAGDRQARQINTAMVALAWCVINCPDDGESATVLARMVLEAAEEGPVDL
jgi:hypothetical protein